MSNMHLTTPFYRLPCEFNVCEPSCIAMIMRGLKQDTRGLKQDTTARPLWPSGQMGFGALTLQNFGKPFYCIFFYRYDGSDQDSRGRGALTLGLSEKSKMAANMAAMAGVHTILAMIPAVFMLLLCYLEYSHSFQTQGIHLNTYFKDVVYIYWKRYDSLYKFRKDSWSLVSSVLAFEVSKSCVISFRAQTTILKSLIN